MDLTQSAPGQAKPAEGRRESFSSQNSQTAKEFIESQIRLEADAREVLPYVNLNRSFDSCTYDLGPLRQNLFACLTCNPVPEHDDDPYTPAAVCYSCSIACHGEHALVELFNKRGFVCDCGTTRMPATSLCSLREDPKTGRKGVHSQEASTGNKYNHNFRNQFCGCGEKYDPHQEKGTMFQCLGLGTVETGGCGEDWWHPECLIGLPRDWHSVDRNTNKTKPPNAGGDDSQEGDAEEDETPLPPGFPGEDDFWQLICFKCLDSNPWLKQYAGSPGFLPPVYQKGGLNKKLADKNIPQETYEQKKPEEKKDQTENPKKRKAEDDEPSEETPSTKRTKEEGKGEVDSAQDTNLSELAAPEKEPASEPKQDITSTTEVTKPKHASLPDAAPIDSFSLFVKEDFYDHLCRCAECFPKLAPFPQLREEEDTYEPPLSDDGEEDGAVSTGTGSLLERGEAALSNVDRVRAIEGAMIYNHLRDKVKDFLKPFAESGQAVSAEDIKGYFEKLRGDGQGIQDAAGQAEAMGSGGGGGGDDAGSDNRREQNGY
ncbi:hypothetical protein N7532_002087 [Penicillium argentinense]|uniref:UBR-type domain-containing protein n=1 Tax=Penicillium argentinense TaxID=1131581 RepID=A0A9W9G3X3_9EURO|nr:uncharacterized protein N7532_002087 [Penicillium argentinense]KAJ5111552.1 hypothetical protein N7532_002087 [Penicillium argentinense]